MIMKQTRRASISAAGSAAASVLFAACGAPGADGSAASRQIKEAVTIDFQHRWEGVREPLVQQQVEAFSRLQPNIKINNQMVFCSGGEGCSGGMPYDKIITQITAGTPPDLFMILSPVAADFSTKGLLRDHAELAKRDRIDPPKTFYPALIEMATTRGRLNGLPQLTAGDHPYFFLSEQVWASAGLDTKNGPRSWDDVQDRAQKLTQRGTGPGGFDRIGYGFPGLNFAQWASTNNVKILTDDAGKVAFNTQEGVDTLQWMLSSMQQQFGSWENRVAFYAGVRGTGVGADRVPLYTGKVGFWNSGIWHFFEIKGEAPQHNPAFTYNVTLLPYNTKNPQARQRSLATEVWLYSIPQSSKKVDAAWEFCKYITLGEGNRTFVKAQGRASPAIKVNDDPEFSKENPHWPTIKKALELAYPLPQTPAWPRVNGVLTAMQNDVMQGKKAPREALNDAARDAQVILDEYRR